MREPATFACPKSFHKANELRHQADTRGETRQLVAVAGRDKKGNQRSVIVQLADYLLKCAKLRVACYESDLPGDRSREICTKSLFYFLKSGCMG